MKLLFVSLIFVILVAQGYTRFVAREVLIEKTRESSSATDDRQELSKIGVEKPAKTVHDSQDIVDKVSNPINQEIAAVQNPDTLLREERYSDCIDF